MRDNNSQFSNLRSDQVRQTIDVEQVFDAYRASRAEHDGRFAGTMSWKRVAGREYLYRKRHGTWKSLGPRGEVTERAHAAFHEGRTRNKERLAELSKRLNQMAPVNRALQLGRVPLVAARAIRALAGAGLMGTALMVVGTNALFGYERLTGVQIRSAHLATGDIDLLRDSRVRLRLLGEDLAGRGVLGILQSVDQSFALTGRGSFRAVNRDGYMVDLIQPAAGNPMSPATIEHGSSEDLNAVEIEGLVWLVNSPKIRAVVIDDRGFPLELVAPDPRAFALHKSWLATRPDRDPPKRLRDEAQAKLVAELVMTRMPHLRFDDPALGAIPKALRSRTAAILPPRPEADQGEALTPDW